MMSLFDLYEAGKLKLDEQITRTYRLEEANEALEDLRAGLNIRGMILFD